MGITTVDVPADAEPAPVQGASGSTPSARAHRRRPLWVVPVLIGTAIRLLHWAVITPDWAPRSDARQYVELARSLAAGRGFAAAFPGEVLHPTAFRPPLYPFLLSLPMRVTGPDALWPGRLLAIVIGAALIALTVAYTRRIAGDRAGMVAGLVVAVAPSLVANDTITMTESLGLLLMMGVLLAVLEDRFVLAGALSGVLMLTRPNAYLVVLVVVVAAARSLGWRRAAAAFGVSLAVVTPWVLRNAVEVGTPKLVTSDGFTLAAMYGPPALRSGGFMDPTASTWYRDRGVWALQDDEAAWSDRLSDLAVTGIRSDPASVLRRAASGAATMLEVPGFRAHEAELVDGRDPRLRESTLFLFPVLVLAGSAGVALRIGDRRTWPALGVVGGFVALSLVTVSVPRLRGPFDLLMAIGVGYLAAWWQQRGDRPPPGAVASIPVSHEGDHEQGRGS